MKDLLKNRRENTGNTVNKKFTGYINEIPGKAKAFIVIVLVSLIALCYTFCSSKKYTEMAVYPLEEEVETRAGGSGVVNIKIEIPVNHYIYGNPKGPGIGKATEFQVESPEGIVFSKAEYLPAQKYIAPGFKKFVWTYRNETTVGLPYIVSEGMRPGVYPVKIDMQALLCSESACTLKEFAAGCSISVTPGDESGGGLPSGNLREPGETAGPGEAAIQESDEGTGAFSPRYLSSGNISNILQAILYGLLAGFLLNFMPCVLPVISLKIMDIVKHSGDDRREFIKLGSSFTFGIILSFAVLAGLAAFMGYNFGALFQKKAFLIVMIAIVFALTLSLFEVFTINIPSFSIRTTKSYGRRATDKHPPIELKVKNERTSPYADAFGKGVLTTLLATPCSGPFLGGTLAWAFTQTPTVIFIIFISVGTGMALPYIVLTINPGLVRFIPKPGNWMITFERVMAFLLMATTIYLIGILEDSMVMPTLWFLLFVAIAFWQYGRFGSVIMAKRKRIISRVLLVIIIVTGYFLSYKYFYGEKREETVVRGQRFNLSKIHENRKNGVVSIIDFTADWCPNCKLVEKTSLYTADVYKAVKDNGVELFVADLTRENTAAENLLRDLGSRSIPFLAIFPPGKAFYFPICLRDIYSEDDVLLAIRHAGEERVLEE